MTRVGDRNMFVVGSHLGHDGRVGDDCTLVNVALVGGHAELQSGCILSGHSAVQQRVRVGRLAMIGGLGSATNDIPAFVIQQGDNCVSGLNLVGLRRSGMSGESIAALRIAFRILDKEGRTQAGALEMIAADLGAIPEVAEFVSFIQRSEIGISPARDPGWNRRRD